MISCHQAGIFTVTFRDRIHCSGLEEEINDDRRSTRMTDGGRPNIATTIWRTVTDHEAGRMENPLRPPTADLSKTAEHQHSSIRSERFFCRCQR